jgi:protein TonB
MSATLKIRNPGVALRGDDFTGGFARAVGLHVAIAAGLAGWAVFTNSGHSWGNNVASGSIQATMVSALPLAPKHLTNPDSVLATEAPTPAPAPPTPRTIETPRPDAIDLPANPAKPVPTADRTTPPPPAHPQPVKVDPDKAQTGESTGPNVAMSSNQTRIGTFSVGVTDNAFGTRFAYYIEQINRKVASEWNEDMLDARAGGHRVDITFQIARDGTPSHIKMEHSSGDLTLDKTALSALQHIDTFGPLPDAYQGTYVNVQYYFEATPHP